MSKKFIVLKLLTVLTAAVLLSSCVVLPLNTPDNDSGTVSEGKLYFHDTKTAALLIESNGSLLWLYSNDVKAFEDFDTGDYVRVSYDYVMESYPGQTYINKITLVEDGDFWSLTDEDWEKLSLVFADIEIPPVSDSNSEGTVPTAKPEDATESPDIDGDSGTVSEGRLYFVGTRDKALLLGEDGALTWLYADDAKLFEGFDTGDRVSVSHGAIMMSYPGQTHISRVVLIEDGDASSFTDEEKALLERVSDGFR